MNAVRWIRSDFGQSVLALWGGYLLFLILMHVVRPDDPWNRVFFNPVFLVVVPVLAGCIPVVGTKPEWVEDDLDSAADWGFARKPRRSLPDAVRRFLMVWLATLIIFISPHGMRASYIDPLVHRAGFLVLAPLWLAAISLFTPWRILPRSFAPPQAPVLSRAAAWNGIVSCVVLAVMIVGALLVIYDTVTPATRMNAMWRGIFFVACLIAVLMRARYFVRRLRSER